MINFNEDTIQDISTKPDRFGMAAISTIFKAFGDDIRSKEYWPWSKNMGNDWAWENSRGCENDLEYAKELIQYALWRIKYSDEEISSTINNSDLNLKKIIREISKINDKINTSINITNAINKTTEETRNESEDLINN